MARRQVVVVTGASAGVGRATARAFALEGASVGLLARGTTGLAGAREELEALGAHALAVPYDFAEADQVENAAALVEAAASDTRFRGRSARVPVTHDEPRARVLG